MVASAGTVVANAGKFGGMRGAARDSIRQNLTDFDIRFHHALLSGAADLTASRIPPGLG